MAPFCVKFFKFDFMKGLSKKCRPARPLENVFGAFDAELAATTIDLPRI